MKEVLPTEPQVFLAREQTAGKGTHGREWVSLRDTGLYLSLLCQVRGDCSKPIPIFTEAIGVSTIKWLEQQLPAETGKQLTLKAPNDIYADGKKLAGLLVETRLDKQTDTLWIVTGLGLNSRAVERPILQAKAPPTSLEALGVKPANWLSHTINEAHLGGLLTNWLAVFEAAFYKTRTRV